jgi:D-beta-D-heptose 7-phosphate kinase / D-beta-D-heptose 1-phosphate adenosyltransferase
MPTRIAVLGDPMLDVWLEGQPLATADGPGLLAGAPAVTPGGAANAARQLCRQPGVAVSLVGPLDARLAPLLGGHLAGGLDLDLAFRCPQNPEKVRYLGDDGRVLFRADREAAAHGLTRADLDECRDLALKAVRNCPWDAVLLSDYGKGFLDEQLCRKLVRCCRDRGLPLVSDPKHPPGWFAGSTIKCNAAYAARHHLGTLGTGHPLVITGGGLPPVVLGEGLGDAPAGPPVVCVNHVGAGDCFAAHLALALARGAPLAEAARFAHAAGRVYVQHPRGRPPWPFEVARDLDPAGGKVLRPSDLAPLRESDPGRVVFTNGVFRVPHPGHAWLLRWARSRGDVLVVGVNDDGSAARLRPAALTLPLAARLEFLAGLSCVDWAVPFAEDTPETIMEALRPDLLVKGHEYAGRPVPGDGLARAVAFAPAGPHPQHATDLEAALRRG